MMREVWLNKQGFKGKTERKGWLVVKIILSRKGVDSAAGGIPSIVLPNDDIVHVPIPGDAEEKITYSNVKYSKEGDNLANLLAELTSNIHYGKTKVPFSNGIKCHLDPDINQLSFQRSRDWRGCFGQIGAAQTVLTSANVAKGDIFLFFGWFNKTYMDNEKLKFCKGNGFHMIYGWLEIDEMIYTNKMAVPNWLKYHPHMNANKKDDQKNCIYVASQKLSMTDNITGYGVFDKFDESLVLTKEGMSRSKWNLPDFFRNTSITYHSESSWKDNYFQSAFRGQEFVCQENSEITEWAEGIIKQNGTSLLVEKSQ
jgi:hypothetical protein